MKNNLFRYLLGLSLFVVFAVGCKEDDELKTEGTTDDTAFIAFDEFMAQTKAATFKDFAGKEDVNVLNEEEFDRMKKHILFMYEGVEVEHSFIFDDGRMCDCVPIEQQPGLKQPGLESKAIATPPADIKSPEETSEGEPQSNSDEGTGILEENQLDRKGNLMKCQIRNIPMLRLTLESMVKFESLDQYFSKCPTCTSSGNEKAVQHRYAHARQVVNNYGGTSWINLWKPTVPTNQFSLSQQWYVGGSGSGRQTVEGGWQVYPYLYNNTKPNLFIYYTKANYASGTGCYNLSCPGFVQTDNTWVIGGPFNYWSVKGGSQYSFRMTWFKDGTNGHWWLWMENTSSGTGKWVGYYPKTLYGSGQLASYAQSIDFGGEVTAASATAHSGQMGSGSYASAGWQQAAYQRKIFYSDLSKVSRWASLSASSTPGCYTTTLLSSSSADWGQYFYFGGPGCN